jgi:2-dehydropantoate 2-reductase
MTGMRIVIVGAGGVGGFFGAKLARAGEDVTFLARGAHLAAIQRDGLRVRSSIEGEYVAKPGAVDDVRGLPAADAVLLCVKSFDTGDALARVAPVVGPETGIVSLQNGIEAPEKIVAQFGGVHALGGVAYVFATIDAPGVIAHRFLGKIVIGELDGRSTPRVQRLRDAFAGAGVPVDLTAEIHRVMWEKYLFICAQAGMTAVTRAPIGVIRSVPETWRMYRAILEELAAIGARAGAGLPPDIVDRLMANADALSPDTTASLHHDLVSGKRLELEGLHGHAVRLGERYAVPTPMTSAVYAALKPSLMGPPGRRG